MTPIENAAAVTTVVVPYAGAGTYQVTVTPKPGVASTARYSIRLLKDGTSVNLPLNDTIGSIVSAGGTKTFTFTMP